MDKTGKQVAPKGLKKVYGPSSGNKYQITVLACDNAASTVLPPMVIFKGERLNHEWTKGEVPNTNKNILQTWPVILLLDGHSLHYTPEAIRLLQKMK